jgi:hypothetical protein
MLGSRTAAVAIEHGAGNRLAANTIIGGPVGIRLFAPHPGDEPSTGARLDDNVLAKVGQGVVLERSTKVRLRGNLFDGVEDALVADSAAEDAEVTGNVFLSARRWLIDAVRLDAGSNYWGARDLDAASRQVRGNVSLAPFRRAEEAGY